MKKKDAVGSTEWVDPDDAPIMTRDMFQQAELRDGDKLIRRGRPPVAFPKQSVTVRLDQDVLDRLRADGPGWQTRLNEMLRQAFAARQP